MKSQERSPEERGYLREEIVQQLFPNPMAQQCLHETERVIARALTGANPTSGSNRKAAFIAARRNAERLANALQKLDLYTLVSAMGTFEGPPAAGSGPQRVWSLMPQRIAEWQDFSQRLARLSGALESLSEREAAVRRGAPAISDPVTFGVECVGAIWRRFLPDVPLTGSIKNGTFGEFVRAFLSAPPLDFPDAKIRTAVRYYIEKQCAALAGEGIPPPA